MTLNGVISMSGAYIISPNSVSFGADYVKVVEDTPVLTAAEMSATTSSFSDISFMAILAAWQGSPPARAIKWDSTPLLLAKI